ncbi:hypothetical protein MJH12_08325, partial [bacterium]|nr:hypothetical protein [bacterium]
MKYILLYILGILSCFALQNTMKLGKGQNIEKANIVKTGLNNDALFEQLVQLEKNYQSFVESKKNEVLKIYQSKNVKKLRRGPLRKSYSYATKSDAKEATVRYSFYTVKESKGKLDIRAVFDDFRSKLIWERLLKLMAKEALLSNQEKVKESEDKMSSMISMVMKGSGISQIKNRSKFHHLELLGDNVLVFWDSIYKKCSQKKRKQLGIKNCVKGIFIGEIDLRNTVRDFYTSESISDNVGWAQYKKSKGELFLSSLYPSKDKNNIQLYSKLKESYQ